MNNIAFDRLFVPELQMVDERELMEDREYLMDMYPARARIIMVLIEEECDRLEYEGSPMFTAFPDKAVIIRIADRIFDKVGYSKKDDNLRQLIEVMVCNEFYVRRSRYKRRRKFF